MNRALAAILMLAAAGCGPTEAADEFRDASPSRQGINIKVPESGSQALTSGDYGSQSQKLLGELATWYVVTREVTWSVNGGVAWVLNLCEDIVGNDPTTIDSTHAVWGPYTDPLSPDTFRFTVTKNGSGYDYVLDGKKKGAADSEYVAIIAGHHNPVAKNVGSGTFTIDWTAAQTLARPPKEVGSADVAYDRNAQRDVTIGVAFKQVRDGETGKLVDAKYAFTQVSGGDGAFEFVVPEKDLQGNNSLPERFAVKSRWHRDGAGRCDIEVSGGDLGASSIAFSECWSDTFGRTYFADTAGLAPVEGTEASCAFSTASYSRL